MTTRPESSWLEVERVGDVAVARFMRHRILEDDAVRAAGEELLGLSDDDSCRKLLLNFGNVESLTTAFFGKLLALHRRVEAAGGRLALCAVGPFLREIFGILKLPAAVTVYDDEQQALQRI